MDNIIQWKDRKNGTPGQIIVSNQWKKGFIDNRGRAIWYCKGPNYRETPHEKYYCIYEEGQGVSTSIEITKEDLKKIIEYLP